jgi:hypothetical protein
MKLLLNPKFEYLRNYLTNIEYHFLYEGKEIHHGRNVLRSLTVDGLTICVKRYGKESLRTSLATRLYKTSKGKRAYLRPLELRERGHESPEPIALVRYRHGWLHTTTYLVCLHSHYRYDLSKTMDIPSDKRREVTRDFAHFAARLHEDGFLHRDFSSTNILFDKINGRYHFSLVDTNSIRTGHPVSVDKGCANFSQLVGDDEFFSLLAYHYAEARGADPQHCQAHISRARRAANG